MQGTDFRVPVEVVGNELSSRSTGREDEYRLRFDQLEIRSGVPLTGVEEVQ